MSTDPPFNPPRKKYSILWWLAGLLLLLVLFFVYQLFGPTPRIVVSRETTYITEPLKPNGLPDYEQYMLEHYRQGVTPENNAAVLLLKALWPGGLEPSQYAGVIMELGMDRLPSAEDALAHLHGATNRRRVETWLRAQAEPQASPSETPSDEADFAMDQTDWDNDPFDPARISPSDSVIDQAMSRPWTSQQIPPIAQWITENKVPLDLIVEASRRPRYFQPSPTLVNKQSETLIEILLPHVQSVREAARALPARAMWHVGEGRPIEAWQDLLALHRLSRLVAQGGTLVEQLVAMAISGIACNATVTMLDDCELSPEQARQIERDLAALPDVTSLAGCYDGTERLAFLDMVVTLSRPGEYQRQSDFGFGEAPSFLSYVAVDWNLVLRKGNQYYDRLTAAARLPTWAARRQALSQTDNDIRQLSGNVKTPGTLVAAAMSPRARGDAVASILLNLCLPATGAATTADDRAKATFELTRLAAALAVYRAGNGSYPQKLDELVPDVIDKLPVDLYTAKPFFYGRTDDGYLLYCAGENGVDDGGSHETMTILEGRSLDDLDGAAIEQLQPKIPAGADDISIRVPRPKFTLPNLPASP